MTARPEIVARICDRLQFITGAAPDVIAHDKSLTEQAGITSLDLFDLELDVEDEFDVRIEFPGDWTIDSIADAVIAAMTTPSNNLKGRTDGKTQEQPAR